MSAGRAACEPASRPRGARVLLNSILLFLTRIGVLVFSVLLTVATAKALGAEGLGGYALVVSFAVIFQTVASLGLNYILPREVGRDRSRAGSLFVNASFLSTAASAVFGLLLGAVGRWLGYGASLSFCLALAGLSVLPGTLITLCEGVFTACEDVRTITVVTAVEYLARYLASLAVLWLGGGLVALTVVFVASRFLGLATSLFYLGRTIGRPRLKLEGAVLRELLSLMPVFAGLYVVVVVMLRADIVILSKVRDTAEAGLYSAAFRIYDLCALVPATAATVVYPLLSERAGAAGGSLDPLRDLARKSLSSLLALCLPLVVVLAFLARPVVGLLYDPIAFAGAVPCLVILMLSLVPYSLDPILGYTLLATGRQKVDLVLVGIGAGATIALNLVLASLWGARGTAAATLVSTALLATIHARYVRAKLFPLGFLPIAARPVGAAAAAALVLAATHALGPVARGALGLGAYTFVLLATGFFHGEDIAAVRSLLPFSRMRPSSSSSRRSTPE